VQEKFGAEENAQTMRGLLHLSQKSSLEEYIHAFEEARYATILHNPEMGETFFVSQFVKGLKGELQGHVLAQLSRTVDRAILLAQIQREVVEINRAKFPLQLILKEFEDVFAVSTGLPSTRVYDHHIPLLPGSIPVNSRPYRYSPFHKTEIER
jgi:hypothetical protein